MPLQIAMGGIEPGNGHASRDERRDEVGVPRARPDGGDNLRLAHADPSATRGGQTARRRITLRFA